MARLLGDEMRPVSVFRSGVHSVILTKPSWTSCVVRAMASVLTLMSGKQVGIAPVVGLSGRAAQLYLHAAHHEILRRSL